MKPLLHLSLFTALIFSFSSCIKSYETLPPAVVDPLVGSWYLYDASESAGNGWYSFDAGVGGVLSFYGNGTAQYDDGNVIMQGNWYTTDGSDSYYDQYGNYYTDAHQSFQTLLSGISSLSLYFDDIAFAGNNEFIGTYYTGKTIERYTFKRD